ncbi:hypothetical protein ACIRON_02565 [Nocardioides sp. NPDC101246]|uniref:hypothetical protein n=1 Tax=Nocardioides sp. NPDC101246 TaxID=3364336 RepID=UPI0037FF0005
MKNMRSDVMLSMMRALWGQVTADLRGVAVQHQGSSERGSIEGRFLYEGGIGDVQAECVSLAETYCIADFPPEVSVQFQASPHATRDLLPGEHWVFLRWEPEH